MKPKIIIILGPTSTGKSDLAVQLALAYDGEVVSADSRQLYTGLNIGTGKITKKEMRGVPHHMLDIVYPKKIFSVGEWKKIADEKIADIISCGKVPIICGGTGFYIQSIVDNFVLPEVEPNYTLRARLEKKSAQELFEILIDLDPQRAATIEKKNPVRLIRAIEIIETLGKVPRLTKQENTYDILQIGLTLLVSELQTRIHMRLLDRINKGMIQEAQELYDKGLSWKRMHSLGLEYSFLADFLQKKISKLELLTQIEKGNLDYAKRQMTWFKRDKNILWFRPDESEKIFIEVGQFLKKM